MNDGPDTSTTGAVSREPRDCDPGVVDDVDRLVASFGEVLDGVLEKAERLPPTRAEIFARLEPNATGFTTHVYTAGSIRAWEQLAEADPDDPFVAHHVAVSRHARAFDLEAGRTPSRSNRDWQRALEAWQVVWRSDAFWTSVLPAVRDEREKRAVSELRESLPRRLLRIHADVAFHETTKLHRAQFHVRLIRECGFPEPVKADVLDARYERFVADVPEAAWQPHVLDDEVLAVAVEVIERYLDLDPFSRPALCDALRLQMRRLNDRYVAVQALPEDSDEERRRLRDEIVRSGRRWRPCFDRLVDVADELDPETRDKLGLWYRVNADFGALEGNREEALRLYAQGLRCTEPDGDEHRRCREGRSFVQAVEVRQKVLDGHADARAACDRLLESGVDGVTTRFVLANAFQLLHEYEIALRICDETLAAPASSEDAEGRRELKSLRESIADAERRFDTELLPLFGSREAWRLWRTAADAMNAGRHAEAVEMLRDARELSPESPRIAESLATALTARALELATGPAPHEDRVRAEATALLSEAIRADPGNDTALAGLRSLM